MKSFLKKNIEKIGIYSFVGIILICFYFLFSEIDKVTGALGFFSSVLSPFVLGFAVSYILWPFVKGIENIISLIYKKAASLSFFEKLKKKKDGKEKKNEKRNGFLRGISILIVYFLVVVAVALLVNRVIPQIVDSATTLVKNIPHYIEQIDAFVVFIFSKYSPDNVAVDHTVIYDFLMQHINSITEWGVSWLINVPKVITSGISNLILGIILSIYFIFDKENFQRITKKVIEVVFGKISTQIFKLGNLTGSCFSEFFMGKIIDSLIIGLLAFPFMLIIYKPYALLISAIIGITNIIPYFGPIIGAIPGALIILISAPEKILWYLIFVLVLQQFDGNILGPKILGNRTGLSPVGVIFGIIAGSELFGFAGMIIGVPLTAVLHAILKEFINKRSEIKEQREQTETENEQNL